jgi:hypothetical protein
MAARIPFPRVVIALAVFAALWWFTPAADPAIRLCGFHWLTGMDCPFCGLTRGLFALAKGHWSEAIHFNALTPLGFTMLFALIFDAPWLGRLWSLGAAAFAVYGISRIVLL